MQRLTAMFAEPCIRGETTALGAKDLFSHLRTQDTIKEILCQWGNYESVYKRLFQPPLAPPVLGEKQKLGDTPVTKRPQLLLAEPSAYGGHA